MADQRSTPRRAGGKSRGRAAGRAGAGGAKGGAARGARAAGRAGAAGRPAAPSRARGAAGRAGAKRAAKAGGKAGARKAPAGGAARRGAGARGRAAGAPEIRAKNVTREDVRFLTRYGGQLSPSTLRAKWVHSADEHEDRPGQTLATRSHEVIQSWADERGAAPATVPGTGRGGRPGVLRFDFPGYGGKGLQAASWEDWFRPFDRRRLVFLFQEHKADGTPSNFFRLDSPEREAA